MNEMNDPDDISDILNRYQKANRSAKTFGFVVLAGVFFVSGLLVALMGNQSVASSLLILSFISMMSAQMCSMMNFLTIKSLFNSLSQAQLTNLFHSGQIQGDGALVLVEAMNKACSKSSTDQKSQE